MKTRALVATIALLGALARAAAAQDAAPAGPEPARPLERGAVFKSGVELVALNVTVTDPQQRYITGLQRDDFAVFEDGVQQDVSFFASGELPLDLAIVLDASSSMTEKMSLVRQAATGFARTLRRGDRGAIVEFNSGVRFLQPWTSDIASLEAAIQQTKAQGNTALYNAVYVTLKEFAKETRQSTDVRRQAIVVLSDGEDTASVISFEDALDVARRNGVVIYTIAMRPQYSARGPASTSRYFSQAGYAMKALAQETGAQSFFPSAIAELDGVYGVIAKELSLQYAIGYASKNRVRNSLFRRVVVRILSRPEARLRARLGYFADAGLTSAILIHRPE